MRRLTAAALAALLLLLAGCDSGHSSSTSTGHVPPPPAPTVRCDPTDATMRCVLSTLPPPPERFSLHPGQLYGVDGFGPPAVATLNQLGARFAAAYWSRPYSNPKNWTAGAVRAYRAARKGTVDVWETTQTRAEEGPLAGAQDARDLIADQRTVGNRSGPARFAVDCDCALSQIRGYFQGARTVAGARTNAYGGYRQILGLRQLGLVGRLNWQTYAWSGGRWLPASIAPLEQYLNGSRFDNDRALAANYGQWPAPRVPTPDMWPQAPNVTRHFGRDHAREHHTLATWRTRRCRNPVRRPVCKSTRRHLLLLEGRIWTVATRHGHLRPGHRRWRHDHLGIRFQYLARELREH